MTENSESLSSTQTDGRFTRLLKQWMLDLTTVVQIQSLAEGFRLITLQFDNPKLRSWTAGDKVQIVMGKGLSARTYTPFNWDARERRFDILVYLHDSGGPGSDWAHSVRSGEQYSLLGPRKSLAAPKTEGPVMLIGDESCFGLAAAFKDQQLLRCLFEVDDLNRAQQVLAQLGLASATLVQRAVGDTHWEQMGQQMPGLDQTESHYMLAGKASSIQRARRWLKNHGVSNQRMHAKAYWAPGKKGLD